MCSDKVKTCIESSESQSTCIESSGNQDLDDLTLACFLHNKPKKRSSRCTKNSSQASFSSRIIDVSKQVESPDPFDEQSGLSQSCDTVGTKALLVQQNVTSDRQVRQAEDANTLTDDDDGDMTLACFLGNKPKKVSPAAKRCGALGNEPKKGNHAAKGQLLNSSSKLKKGSTLQHEGHCASKQIIKYDDSGPSMSNHVEEETVLQGGVAELVDINVEENDDFMLSSLLQSRPKRERKRPSRFS